MRFPLSHGINIIFLLLFTSSILHNQYIPTSSRYELSSCQQTHLSCQRHLPSFSSAIRRAICLRRLLLLRRVSLGADLSVVLSDENNHYLWLIDAFHKFSSEHKYSWRLSLFEATKDIRSKDTHRSLGFVFFQHLWISARHPTDPPGKVIPPAAVKLIASLAECE